MTLPPLPEEDPTERRLREAFSAHAASVRPHDLTQEPVPSPRRRSSTAAPLAAAVAVLVAVAAGGVVSHSVRRSGAPQSGASSSASSTSAQREVTVSKVSIDLPADWRADPYGTATDEPIHRVPPYIEATCLHPTGTPGGMSCLGGISVYRMTAESAAGYSGLIQISPFSAFCPLRPDNAPNQISGGGRDETVGVASLGDRKAVHTRVVCDRGPTFSVWTVKDANLVLRADEGSAEAVSAVNGARIADAGGPASMQIMTQGNGFTFTVPLNWSDFSRASICVGPATNFDDIQRCPIDGVVVRGEGFFAGKGSTVPRQGGAVTVDPWSVLGYVPTSKKLTMDIPSGCDRLHNRNTTSGPSAGVKNRVLVDSGTRTVAGVAAEYRAWKTTCADGETFTWRRWWVESRMTMVDSYDQPGGGDPDVIDDLLASRTTWGESY